MKKLLVIACLFAFTAPVAVSYANTPIGVYQNTDQDEKKEEIAKEALPEPVKDTLKEDYSKMEIDKIVKVTKPDDTKYFAISFSTEKGKVKTVKFDAEGEVIG